MIVNVVPEVIDRLARLEREMSESGRSDDAAALAEAMVALARPGQGWLTTGQAAERLGVARETIKNWLRRGTLRGMSTGTRWLISAESVETIEGIRQAVAEAAAEGYPTPEEIDRLTRRARRAASPGADVA